MKKIIRLSSYFFFFSFFLSCKSVAQEKATDVYLAKMIQLTEAVDSLVGQENGLNCDTFRSVIGNLSQNLFQDDSLVHSVTIELREDNVFYACGGAGYWQYWEFPKGGAPCKCAWSNSMKFETKNFGKCYFERKEGPMPPLIKNGVSYDYMLDLNLRFEKKYKRKYAPTVHLNIFMPVNGAF